MVMIGLGASKARCYADKPKEKTCGGGGCPQKYHRNKVNISKLLRSLFLIRMLHIIDHFKSSI